MRVTPLKTLVTPRKVTFTWPGWVPAVTVKALVAVGRVAVEAQAGARPGVEAQHALRVHLAEDGVGFGRPDEGKVEDLDLAEVVAAGAENGHREVGAEHAGHLAGDVDQPVQGAAVALEGTDDLRQVHPAVVVGVVEVEVDGGLDAAAGAELGDAEVDRREHADAAVDLQLGHVFSSAIGLIGCR